MMVKNPKPFGNACTMDKTTILSSTVVPTTFSTNIIIKFIIFNLVRFSDASKTEEKVAVMFRSLSRCDIPISLGKLAFRIVAIHFCC